MARRAKPIRPSGLSGSLSNSDRRQRRSADIRERLFRAALDLFAQKGFAETTVEDITEAADVGKGTFFNYFPSKDHILLAFGEMQLGKLEAAIDAARRTNEPMPQLQKRVQALHTEMIRLGQKQGAIRNDLPAEELAYVFRQTIFGTLLIWSLYGDATLHSRIESAFNVLWTGLTPRGNPAPSASVPFFTCGD